MNEISLAIPHAPVASYPLRSGNVIRPLVDGEPAFRRVCEALEAAKRSVWVTVTFMWAACQMPDGRGTPLDVLKRVAARGIDVRIIVLPSRFLGRSLAIIADSWKMVRAGGKVLLLAFFHSRKTLEFMTNRAGLLFCSL